MSIGRGRSICEYDEIMQILPGSSDNAVYKCIESDLQYRDWSPFRSYRNGLRISGLTCFLDANRSPLRLKTL